MSRSNSMTNAGQCRLAPLIPCIQDSSPVYDFIVKLLFKLHNCKAIHKYLFKSSFYKNLSIYINDIFSVKGLPPETLEGHRIRFLKQFKGLRQFYLQSSTLQYFKTLIQVPHLDEVIIVMILIYKIHFASIAITHYSSRNLATHI